MEDNKRKKGNSRREEGKERGKEGKRRKKEKEDKAMEGILAFLSLGRNARHTQLKGGGETFGSWLQGIQPMVSWLHCRNLLEEERGRAKLLST